jgi:methionyl-tRNA formyltransferase
MPLSILHSLSDYFIEFFKQRKGCINLHGGKTPEYRGASVMRWQIVNGESKGAFTIMNLEKELDCGNILAEHVYEIEAGADIGSIIKLEHEVFPKLLLDTLKKIKIGQAIGRKQSGKACYWHKRREKDRQIFWKDMTCEQVLNLVRAETLPYAGAFCYIRGIKLRILEAQNTSDQIYKGTPGRIARTLEEGVVVIAKDKGLLLSKISLDGRRTKDAVELLKYGDQLE